MNGSLCADQSVSRLSPPVSARSIENSGSTRNRRTYDSRQTSNDVARNLVYSRGEVDQPAAPRPVPLSSRSIGALRTGNMRVVTS